MGKHCVSAIKHAEIEGVFSSWQDGRLKVNTVIFDIVSRIYETKRSGKIVMTR